MFPLKADTWMKRQRAARGSSGNFQVSVSSVSVRRSSAVLPSVLTFLVIVASGGLLMMIERGMLNRVDTHEPRAILRRADTAPDPGIGHGFDDVDFQISRDIQNRTIRTMCSQKNIPHNMWSLNPLQRKTLLQHILVDDKYGFLYCYVPKVACSNWKRVLKVLNGALEDVKVKTKLNHHADIVFLNSLKPDEIKYRLKHYYKFMFVRDPMARLLSAYRNKFGEIESYQKKYGVDIIKRYRKGYVKDSHTTGDDVTFEEFIHFLLDEDVERMNEHWMPMYNLCQPCVIPYDFIGSHEYLERDAEFVLRQIKAPPSIHFPERQAWYKPVTTETIHYYLCRLPQRLLKDLLSKYILDFSLFAYPLPNITTEYCRH